MARISRDYDTEKLLAALVHRGFTMDESTVSEITLREDGRSVTFSIKLDWRVDEAAVNEILAEAHIEPPADGGPFTAESAPKLHP